ncbi:hypothetical protein TNCV_1003671 [Trichonephila clavipes]|nr:hypothetical protein TNCV_1003671 [Trichonephila clavipes]
MLCQYSSSDVCVRSMHVGFISGCNGNRLSRMNDDKLYEILAKKDDTKRGGYFVRRSIRISLRGKEQVSDGYVQWRAESHAIIPSIHCAGLTFITLFLEPFAPSPLHLTLARFTSQGKSEYYNERQSTRHIWQCIVLLGKNFVQFVNDFMRSETTIAIYNTS